MANYGSRSGTWYYEDSRMRLLYLTINILPWNLIYLDFITNKIMYPSRIKQQYIFLRYRYLSEAVLCIRIDPHRTGTHFSYWIEI